MSQTTVGILCLLVSIVNGCLNVPNALLSIRQLRDGSEGGPMNTFKWKVWSPIAGTVVSVVVLILGIYLLIHKTTPSAPPPNLASESPQVGTPQKEDHSQQAPVPKVSIRPPSPKRPSVQTAAPASGGTQSVGSVDVQTNFGNVAGINNGTLQTNYGVSQPPPQLVNLR